MKISTKGRYALRLMTDIAAHDSDGYVSLKDVAARQGISMKYSEQIAGLLAKAGLLHSGRGAQGGYRLAKRPEDYTVGSILRLTEDSLAPVSCLGDGAPACPRMASCRTLSLWQGLDKVISDYLDNITIADLVRSDTEGNDYVI